MPNHVRSSIVVKTANDRELREIEEFVQGIGEDGNVVSFSFQQIMPCPMELMPDETGVSPDRTQEERRRLTAIYGYDDWYYWRVHNWGTKWDCYEHDHEPGSPNWGFSTAWNTPSALMKYLSKKFPTAVFTVHYADEDLGRNCGSYELKDGKIISETEGDLWQACSIWGYDYEEELAARRENGEDEDEDKNNKETYSQPAMCPECGSKSTWSNSSGELQCDNCGFSETE